MGHSTVYANIQGSQDCSHPHQAARAPTPRTLRIEGSWPDVRRSSAVPPPPPRPMAQDVKGRAMTSFCLHCGPSPAHHPLPAATALTPAAGQPHTCSDCHASHKEVPGPTPGLTHLRQSLRVGLTLSPPRRPSPIPRRAGPTRTGISLTPPPPGRPRARPPPRWPPPPRRRAPRPPARASPSARTRRTRSRSSPSSTVCPTKSVWSRPAAPPREPGPARKSSADCSSDMATAPRRAPEQGARGAAASGSAQQPPAPNRTIFRPDAVT